MNTSRIRRMAAALWTPAPIRTLADETGTRSVCATCAAPITLVPCADGDAWAHDTPVGGDHYATPATTKWQARYDDETPGLTAGESARLGELYTQRQQAKPRAEAGRWEPRTDDEAAPRVEATPAELAQWSAYLDRRGEHVADSGKRHMPVTEAVQREMAQLLLERDEANQRADALAERLRQRNRMLGQFLSPAAVAELDRADRAWIGHADTAQPVPSRPGLAIDVTQPGDNDELFIGRPW